jgi:aminoglycoside 6'-N-acetyltransferase I
MKTIIFEPITSANILSKCASLLVEVYNAEPWNDNWSQETAMKKLQYAFDCPNFVGFVAMQGEKLVGCLVGNIEPNYDSKYLYLRDMFVSVQSQRMGIGTQLLAAMKTDLKAKNIRDCIFFTSQKFYTFDFYKKNGFELMGDMAMMYGEV